MNQDEKLYDGFGDVTAEYKSVNGAVTIGSTQVVQYTYSDGVNNSDALTGTVYPDGYTVTDNYAGTTDTAISRLSPLSDSSGNVASYTYVNAMIFRDTPASGTRVWAEQAANYNVVVLVGASGAIVGADRLFGVWDADGVFGRSGVLGLRLAGDAAG